MLSTFINDLLARHQFCTWGEAARACGVERFKPSEIPGITSAFRAAVPGSDALIVNAYGLYGKADLAVQHQGFLQANGYEKVPGVMPEKPRTSQKTKVSDLERQIADLKAQLAGVVAKAA